MTGLLIFLFVIILLWWLWPIITRTIRAWVMRKLQRQAEDYIRRATGMPPHDATERKHTDSQHKSSRAYRSERTSRGGSRRGYHHSSEPIIPKEYAVDVEYTEIKDYSADTIIAEDHNGSTRTWHESQVSDAEWVEIKTSHLHDK